MRRQYLRPTRTRRANTQLPYPPAARRHGTGAYPEPTYRLARAALNLGVRYDYSKGASRPWAASAASR